MSSGKGVLASFRLSGQKNTYIHKNIKDAPSGADTQQCYVLILRETTYVAAIHCRRPDTVDDENPNTGGWVND